MSEVSKPAANLPPEQEASQSKVLSPQAAPSSSSRWRKSSNRFRIGSKKLSPSYPARIAVKTKNLDEGHLRRILAELESLSDEDAQKLIRDGREP